MPSEFEKWCMSPESPRHAELSVVKAAWNAALAAAKYVCVKEGDFHAENGVLDAARSAWGCADKIRALRSEAAP